ncbi:MAG: hypothetical protein ABI630_08460 [Betaproteobacteria bacterium]
MKKTDLEKLKGLRLKPQPGAAGAPRAPGAPGRGQPAQPGRREQRDLDRAAGLVPFAVKLNEELVAKLHALAEKREGNLNEVVAELLKKGMESKAK